MRPEHHALLAHAMTVGTPEARPDAPRALAAISAYRFFGGNLAAACTWAMAAHLGGIAVPLEVAVDAVVATATTAVTVTAVIHAPAGAAAVGPLEAALDAGAQAIQVALPQEAITAADLPSRLGILLERCHAHAVPLIVVLPHLPSWLSRLEVVARSVVHAGVDALGIAAYELAALERLRGWFGADVARHAIGTFANLDTTRRALAAGATHLCTPSAFELLAQAHEPTGTDAA